MQQKFHRKIFQDWHRNSTVPSDSCIFPEPSFGCLHAYCFMVQDGSTTSSSHLQSRQEETRVYHLSMSPLTRKQWLFLEASPGNFLLNLIGQNEVTWLLLSPTRESGKCSFYLFLGKAHCHPKKNWGLICNLSGVFLKFSYVW